MAYLTAPLQGTGANAPQNTGSALVKNELQQGPIEKVVATSFLTPTAAPKTKSYGFTS